MKKLFAVLLAVAMLLSLGVTAFATGDITVANHPDKVAYKAYKVFDVVKNTDGSLTYYIATNSAWKDILWKTTEEGNSTVTAVTPKSRIPGLSFVPAVKTTVTTGEGEEAVTTTTIDPYTGTAANFPGTTGGVYKVVKDVSFSAADFAATLRSALIGASPAVSVTGTESESVWVNKDGTYYPIDPASDVEIKDLDAGYYLVLGAETSATDETSRAFPNTLADDKTSAGSLTTVLDGETVQIQNKSDMPLDKTVNTDSDGQYDDDNTGVNLGDTLNYKIETKAPVLGEENTSYIFQLSDTMTEGLTFNNTLTIVATPYSGSATTYTLTYVPKNPDKNIYEPLLTQKVGEETVNVWQLVTDPKATLTGNQVRFNENGKTFEISFDVSSKDAGSFRGGKDITITYSAVVNENSVVEVLENKVVLSYGNDKDHLINKDDSTKNYLSQILIDKFAEGNETQKLAGAEFKLYKLVDDGVDAYGNAKQKRQYYQLAVVAVDSPNTAVYKFTSVSFQDGKLVVPDELKGTVIKAGTQTDENGKEPGADGYVTTPAQDTINPYNTWWEPSTNDLKAGYIYKLLWVDTEADGTKVVTDTDGAAAFGYLPDGTYYLLETKAPVDYTKLLEAKKIVVDGKAATEPSMTTEQQDMILTNIANVANTPGSTLPSTGGVGATLMTIGGVALILAAGAFLVIRRRKEQE